MFNIEVGVIIAAIGKVESLVLVTVCSIYNNYNF
jgi:hypothetical protein